MTHKDRALQLFDQGCNCCQSVCTAYADELGLDHETALKLSSGFGGGMGRLTNTCGVVTGAFMILGLYYGSGRVGDKVTKEQVYDYVRVFAEKFTDRHGTLMCRELLDCDISTPEGHAQAKAQNLFATRCRGFVGDSAEILEEMLTAQER
ncbi:hypothetical protein GF339_06650 [candidate division KSB3 bacterium]|uniref:C_GCAxxG_C_C family protein n=1 Tax=candidate division KSB3 bacterium TaxID=2044937 RepID=A0A9D5JUH7_9BACT|nr:hypothetical protein [candidate division KSB3 bacterium]MBD3324246.1 hypothetical protein [candidate division KSB3 bacterium]